MLHGADPLVKGNQDSLRWDSSGPSFSIKVAYRLLKEKFPSPHWPIWKLIWRSKAILKIKMFIWTLLKGKILTSDNLKKEVSMAPPDAPTVKVKKRLLSISLWDVPSPIIVGVILIPSLRLI